MRISVWRSVIVRLLFVTDMALFCCFDCLLLHCCYLIKGIIPNLIPSTAFDFPFLSLENQLKVLVWMTAGENLSDQVKAH